MAVNRSKFCKLNCILSKHFLSKYHDKISFNLSTCLVTRKSVSSIATLKTESIANVNYKLSKRSQISQWQIASFSTSRDYLRKGEFQNRRDSDDETKQAGLMDFPEIVWPSLLKTIKSQILSRLIIRLYLDNEFSLDDFGLGARKAFLVLSSILRDGNINDLVNLVTPEAFDEIKRNFKSLTPMQRTWFSIKEEDIYFAYPYQVGIMIEDDSNGIQRRHVEITYCYHCLPGFDNLRAVGDTNILKHRERIFIANCRFIKEFTKNVDSDWTINIYNIFKPEIR